MALRFRLCEKDRAKYGSDEWYEIDLAKLGDYEESGLLEEFEETTGLAFLGELPTELGRGSLRALRAVSWLALKVSGSAPEWAAYRPRLSDAEFEDTEAGEGKGNPPEPGNRASRRSAARTAGKPSAA